MKRIFLCAAFLVLICISVLTYACGVQARLHDSLIRLHIIANSDSDSDQSIKLAVRDAVLSAEECTDTADIDKLIAAAQDSANKYLKENGIPYRAVAEYGEFEFPTKDYGDIALPAGKYNGIKITLGSGNGHNWWCVIYPPLCVCEPDDARDMLRTNVGSDAYEIITKKPNIRFRILELVGNKGNPE